MRPSRTVRNLAFGATTVGVLLAAGAGSAAAHVTVNAPDAKPGGYAVLTFRVPTESATASTTGLAVRLPATQPLASVSVQPKAGWRFTARTAKLAKPIESDDGPITEAVSEIDWTATGSGIRPGEFDEFRLSVGPLPKSGTMTFPAVQRYSDGKDVAWIDVPAPGNAAEPAHPAPSLNLNAATTPSPGPTVTASPAAASPTVAASSGGASRGAVTAALVVAIVAAALGAAAVVLTLASRRRTGSADAGQP